METDCVLKLSNKIILIPLNGCFMYFTIMNAIITISVCSWKNNMSNLSWNDKKEHSNKNTETISFGDSKVNYLLFYQRFSCVDSLFAASFTRDNIHLWSYLFPPLSLLMKGCKGAIRIFWPVRALSEPCG